MLFFPLINVKMPTIVGILTFMSRKNIVLSWVEHEKSFITSGPFWSAVPCHEIKQTSTNENWLFHNDISIPAAYHRLYCQKFMMPGPSIIPNGAILISALWSIQLFSSTYWSVLPLFSIGHHSGSKFTVTDRDGPYYGIRSNCRPCMAAIVGLWCYSIRCCVIFIGECISTKFKWKKETTV